MYCILFDYIYCGAVCCIIDRENEQVAAINIYTFFMILKYYTNNVQRSNILGNIYKKYTFKILWP